MCPFSILEFAWVFFWKHPGTILVIVGVFGEGVELVTKRFWKDWHHKNESRIENLEMIFWAAVLIGLCVEFGEMAESERKSAEINQRAGEAMTLASITESNNLVLRSNVVALEWQAEQLRQKNKEIEIATSPREFIPSQESITRLAKYAGTKFSIKEMSDPEAPFSHEGTALASEIFWALTGAKWVFVTNEPALHVQSIFLGVKIESGSNPAVEPESEAMRAAYVLEQELNIKNIMTSRFPTTKHPEVVVIVVGRKPVLSEIRRHKLVSEMFAPGVTPEERLKLEKKLLDDDQ